MRYLAFSCALGYILKSWKCIFQHLARFDTFFEELYVTGYMDFKLPHEPAGSNPQPVLFITPCLLISYHCAA